LDRQADLVKLALEVSTVPEPDLHCRHDSGATDCYSGNLPPFTVVEGTIEADARVMGGASVPILSNFAIDRDVLFKENAS
jgi:hypothetical protein